MDETYQTYVNRVARLTLPETYVSQLQNIQSSPKYEHKDGEWQAVSFPGYSVTTPPWREDENNEAFYASLQATQEQLSETLGKNFLIPVPPASFHVTIGDLIWDSGYREAIHQNPNFDSQLRDRISQSFQQCQSELSIGTPIQWQLLGLMLRPRAIAVCLVPKEEKDYARTLQLRRCIYQNSGLMGLGVEQQYHFTAHVTLGYFGKIPSDLNRTAIAETLNTFNERWLEADSQVIQLHRAELRHFENMTRYNREPDFPVLEF